MSAGAFLRVFLKYIAIVPSWLVNIKPSRASILAYHRVEQHSDSEFDISKHVFYKQMAVLANSKRVLSLGELLHGNAGGDRRHRVVITFDDACDDFYRVVYPILKKLNVPATLYVPAGFIDSPDKFPLGKYRPCSWAMLDELSRCPLITIASHAFSHQSLLYLSEQDVRSELVHSKALIERQISKPVKHFAWPYGHYDLVRERIAEEIYESVALFGGGSIRGELSTKRLPRVSIRRSDKMFWFRLKYMGFLDFEDIIRDCFKRFLKK